MKLAHAACLALVPARPVRELGIAVRRLESSPYRKRTVLGRDLELRVDVASSDTASRTGWKYVFLGGDPAGHRSAPEAPSR